MKYTGERIVPDSKECSDSPLLEEHLERYVLASKFAREKSVLDAACGTGYGSELMVKRGAKNVNGIDISREAIEYAKKHFPSKKIRFAVMDGHKLKFKNNQFDTVVSFETIEHMKDYRKFLSEVSRVLKNKGTLVLSTPNKSASEDANNEFHVKEFDENDLMSELSKYFKIVTVLGQRERRKPSTTRNFLVSCISMAIRLDKFGLYRRLLPVRYIRPIGKKAEDFSHNYKPYKLSKNRGIPRYFIAICKNKIKGDRKMFKPSL